MAKPIEPTRMRAVEGFAITEYPEHNSAILTFATISPEGRGEPAENGDGLAMDVSGLRTLIAALTQALHNLEKENSRRLM